VNNKNLHLIEEAFRMVDINRGDVILVHSDSTAIRDVTGLSWLDSLNFLKIFLLNLIGENGTLIVPTFNWDFCKGKPYSNDKTRSQVGMFSNIVLNDNRSIRSLHPIYSFSGIGPHVSKIFNNISNSSFGHNSVFSRLHKINAKIVFVNTKTGGFTFAHYVEQMCGVDYRFIKKFKGDVIFPNEEKTDTYDMYVKYLNKGIKPYWDRLYNDLIKHKLMFNSAINNQYPISSVYAKDLFLFIKNKLNREPYYLIKEPFKKIKKK